MSMLKEEVPPLAEEPQCAHRVLMVRPASFYANPETLATNAFQSTSAASNVEVSILAQREFDGAVKKISDAGVEVIVAEADPLAETPDALFPNNWFSTHADGRVVLYPMAAENRRRERRPSLLAQIARGHELLITETIDLTAHESEGLFLEGTGSMVLDRQHRMAYCALSPRTSVPVVNKFCSALGYQPVTFETADANGHAVYHTNVMMSVGPTLAVMATSFFKYPQAAANVTAVLQNTGKKLLQLDQDQINEFAANVLFLVANESPALAISLRAWRSLRVDQQKLIETHAVPIICDVATIEAYGGGGIRCMLAEIFLPRAI